VLASGASTTHHSSWLLLGAALLVMVLAVGVLIAARRFGWMPVPAELRALPPDQRRVVARAVQRGAAVDDPALTDAAVRHARVVESRLANFQGRAWLGLGWTLAVLFGVIAVFDLVKRDHAGAVLHLAIGGTWICNPFFQRRLYQRARQSARLNARLLGTRPPE
jgi:hypothetical protein